MSGFQAPTATTRVAAVIGDPVRHSFSPVIHNAAFSAAGVDAVYVAFPVPPGQAAAAVDAVRTLGLLGLSVTMPHKHDIARACDDVTDQARALGAVNCVSVDGGRVIGDNTDGRGFVRGLADELDVTPDGRSFGIIGAGGAGRAVLVALAQAGAEHITVINRDDARGRAAAALAPDVSVVGSVGDLAEVDVVVNATPLGMASTPHAAEMALPHDLLAALDPATVVCDVVYHPTQTPLLAAAAARGLRTQNGLSMLVHQAAIAFERWTGVEAPVTAMHDAVHRVLALRS